MIGVGFSLRFKVGNALEHLATYFWRRRRHWRHPVPHYYLFQRLHLLKRWERFSTWKKIAAKLLKKIWILLYLKKLNKSSWFFPHFFFSRSRVYFSWKFNRLCTFSNSREMSREIALFCKLARFFAWKWLFLGHPANLFFGS